jgi:hypothetical protein
MRGRSRPKLRPGLGHADGVLLASVSAGVARAAACPVLVVPRGIERVMQQMSPRVRRALQADQGTGDYRTR